jgi:cytidylate kinase
MGESFKHGNELSGYIQFGGNSWVSEPLASQEGLRFMQSANYWMEINKSNGVCVFEFRKIKNLDIIKV